MKDLKVNIFKHLLLSLFCFIVADVYGQNYKTVKAIEGDGIYSILRRNDLFSPQNVAKFKELNKDNLGKNDALQVGKLYKLPTETTVVEQKPGGKSITVNFFGPKYKDVVIKDNRLLGAVYYLISGHGGPDPGAIGTYGKNKLYEDEYNYDVTLRLARRLMEHGATVYIIVQDKNDGIRDEEILKPDKDEVCYQNLIIPLNQVKRLNQRKDIVNRLSTKHKGAYQRLIEIHVDSRHTKQNIDVFFYHAQNSKLGRRTATTMMNVFNEKYDIHQPGRGYKGSVSSRNLHILKNSSMPAVLIELGNINHARDQKRIVNADNRQALANWLAEGALRDYKNR